MPFSDLFGLSTASRLAGDDPNVLNDFQTRQAKQRIADMLIQKGLNPVQGQMAGRFYVGPSWAQGAAQMASAGLGGQLTHQLGDEARDRANVQSDQHQKNIQKLIAAWEPDQGTPGIEAQPAQSAREIPSNLDQIIGENGPQAINTQVRNMGGRGGIAEALHRQTYPMEPGSPHGADPSQVPVYPGTQPPASPPTMEYQPPQSLPATPAVEGRAAIPADNSPETRLRKVLMALAGMNPNSQKILMPFAQMAEKQVEMAQQEKSNAADRELKEKDLRARHDETRALREGNEQYRLIDLGVKAKDLDLRRKETEQKLLDTRLDQQERRKLEGERNSILSEKNKIEREGLQAKRDALAKEKMPTDAQGAANLYANRADIADQLLIGLDGMYSPLGIDAKKRLGKTWGIGGTLEAGANSMLSTESQQAEQAQRDFVNAILRKESGAVINPDEFDNAQKQYFPQAGDTDKTKIQKANNRRTEIDGLRNMSGPLNPARGGTSTPPSTSSSSKIAIGPDGREYIIQGGQWIPKP